MGAWQVEASWAPDYPSMTSRRIAKMSRAEFLKSSVNLFVVGQMSSLGANEIGLYDAAVAPARALTAFAEHTDFVADVCAFSPQAFASVSLDASLLLWDMRFGLRPAGHAGFGGACATGLSSVTAACGSIVMCGSLLGDSYLFDTRVLSRPLLRPPSVRGAVVRLKLWVGDSSPALAALASSEEGLCSLNLGRGISGSGVLHHAKYGDMGGGPYAAAASHHGGGSRDRAASAETVESGEVLQQPRLCFDMARAVGGSQAILACGSWGVTRYRQISCKPSISPAS